MKNIIFAQNKMKVQIPCVIKNFYPEIVESIKRIVPELEINAHILEDFSCCGLPFFEKGSKKESKEIADFNVQKLKNQKVITCNDKCFKTFKVYYPDTLINTVNHNECFDLAQNCQSIFNLIESLELKKSYDFKGNYLFLKDCTSNFQPKTLVQFTNINWIEIVPNTICCGASEGFGCNNPSISKESAKYIIQKAAENQVEKIICMNEICMTQLKNQNTNIEITHYLELIANAL